MKDRQLNTYRGTFAPTALLALSTLGSRQAKLGQLSWCEGNISIALNFWADPQKRYLPVESIKSIQIKN